MADFNSSEIAEALRDEDLVRFRRMLARSIGAPLERLEQCIEQLQLEQAEEIPSKLVDAFNDAFDALYPSPLGPLTLSMFLESRLYDAWDRLARYDEIADIERAASDAAARVLERLRDADGREAEARLTEWQVATLGRIRQEMDVEDAINGLSPEKTRDACTRVLDSVRREIEDLQALEESDEFQDIRTEFLRRDEADCAYYSSITTAAVATIDFEGIMAAPEWNGSKSDAAALSATESEEIEPSVKDVRRSLTEAIAEVGRLESLEALTANDSWLSEVRSHRVQLEVLKRHIGDDYLVVRGGRIRYLYPFSLFALASRTLAAEASHRFKETAESIAKRLHCSEAWSDGNLGGIGFERFEPLLVTDVWSRPGDSDPELSGLRLRLANVTVLPDIKPGDDVKARLAVNEELAHEECEECIEFEASVVLLDSGSHWVEFTAELEDLGPQELYRYVRRGSAQMGSECLVVVREGEEGKSPIQIVDNVRLSDLAKTITHDLGTAISGIALETGESEEIVPVTIPESEFHVILVLSEMERQPRGSAPTRLTSAGGLSNEGFPLGGSILRAPISRDAASLAEWVSDRPLGLDNLLEDLDDSAELLVHSSNCTSIALVGLPDWLAREYEEMVEFVVSLPPLFAVWGRELDDHKNKVLEHLKPRDHDAHAWEAAKPEADPASLAEQIHDLVHHLRQFILEVRERIASFHSDELCKTDQHRRFLTKLMEAADLGRLESNLEARFVAIDQMFARFAEEQEQKKEDNARRRDDVLQILAIVLGVAALAELAALVNTAFDESLSALVIVGQAVVIALIAVVVFVWLRGKFPGLSKSKRT